jgi:hypothetical protein
MTLIVVLFYLSLSVSIVRLASSRVFCASLSISGQPVFLRSFHGHSVTNAISVHFRQSLASFVISGRLTNDHACQFMPSSASLFLSVDVNLIPSQSISDHHHPSVFNPSSPISFHSRQPHLCHFMFVYLLVLFAIHGHDHACFSVSVQLCPLCTAVCLCSSLSMTKDHEH